MPLPRAVPVTLTAAERTTLTKRACGAKTSHRDRLRAQIVLAAACGRDNARIAADLRITVDTARKWRGRFAGRGLEGLADLPRSGRPRRISELTRAAVVALACQLPAATGVPLSRWTVILDLYQGTRLQPGDRILSVDAKPSIQARGRCRPTVPAARGTPVRVEHEYVRHGALALLAALDVRTGKVFASTPPATGIAPFMDLIGQVMSRPGVQGRAPGVRHRGQRLRPPWRDRRRPAPRRAPERDHDSHAGPRILA